MRLLSGIALAVIMSSAATASTVYHWEGNCTLGCAGTASADLTLAAGSPLSFDLNYFPTHDVSDFISFQYTSSSGTFFLDNTSPYLYAQGINNGLLLEENGQGPNTLPLWQFSFNLALADPRGWQFLFGSYFYECLDAQCATWTNDVIRNVGVGGIFTEIQAAAVPGPIAGAGLPGLVMALGGLIVWRRRRDGRFIDFCGRQFRIGSCRTAFGRSSCLRVIPAPHAVVSDRL